jgi:hypothetical protein
MLGLACLICGKLMFFVCFCEGLTSQLNILQEQLVELITVWSGTWGSKSKAKMEKWSGRNGTVFEVERK